jgi:hypothetical protein
MAPTGRVFTGDVTPDRVTRRAFLERAVGATAAAAMAPPLDALRTLGDDRPPMPGGLRRRVVILDPGEHCSIGESLAGYEAALAALDPHPLRAASVRSVPECARLLAVPAVLGLPPSVARLVARCLEGGTTVLLESGAAFTAGGGAPEFRAHRDALCDHLGLRVEAPLPLWPRRAGAPARGVPYVEYTWPSAAAVRDFSRVVPLARLGDDGRGEVIARVDGVPVALRRRVGRGTLLFLGSPLGPALWAGDAEATRWLADVLASARR